MLLYLLLVLAVQSPGQEKTVTKAGLTLTIEGDVEPEMAGVVGNLSSLFYQSYPLLLNRFESEKRPAPRNIRIIFDKNLKIPAHCSGNKVTVSVDWLKKHPEDFPLLTHELTHAVQRYPLGEPGWVTEGIADYARSLYCPVPQKMWALPDTLSEKQSYKNSYRVTGKFFVWLDKKYPGTVDKVHQAMQERSFEIALFKTATGKTIDELWKECVEELKVKK